MSGVFDLADPVGARDIAPTSVAFPPNDSVGILISRYFAARYPAYMCPCQRFVPSLTTDEATRVPSCA